MKIKVTTLVDITETGVRRGPDKLAIGQQSNYDSVIQVFGLRSNPEPEVVTSINTSVASLGFGSSYKGKHNIWELEIKIPEDSNDIKTLQDDFNLVPVITGLTETADLDVSVFSSTDTKTCNIVFKIFDK